MGLAHSSLNVYSPHPPSLCLTHFSHSRATHHHTYGKCTNTLLRKSHTISAQKTQLLFLCTCYICGAHSSFLIQLCIGKMSLRKVNNKLHTQRFRLHVGHKRRWGPRLYVNRSIEMALHLVIFFKF